MRITTTFTPWPQIRSSYTEHIPAGKGRVFSCLQESMAKPDFGAACKAQVEERGSRMQEDYRLDYGVSEACEADVQAQCAVEKVFLCK